MAEGVRRWARRRAKGKGRKAEGERRKGEGVGRVAWGKTFQSPKVLEASKGRDYSKLLKTNNYVIECFCEAQSTQESRST